MLSPGPLADGERLASGADSLPSGLRMNPGSILCGCDQTRLIPVGRPTPMSKPASSSPCPQLRWACPGSARGAGGLGPGDRVQEGGVGTSSPAQMGSPSEGTSVAGAWVCACLCEPESGLGSVSMLLASFRTVGGKMCLPDGGASAGCCWLAPAR